MNEFELLKELLSRVLQIETRNEPITNHIDILLEDSHDGAQLELEFTKDGRLICARTWE